MDLGDAFSWATRDPRWVSKCLLMGLVGLIPVAGQMALLGWLYANLDNLRRGRRELAEAGFVRFRQGAELFVVGLVYAALLVALLLLAVVPAVLLAAQGSRLAALALPLTLLANALVAAANLLFYLAYVPILLAVERHGIAGGLHVPALWRSLRPHLPQALLAGLLVIAAGFVAALGLLACGIGIIFTIPYSYAILAAAVHGYERETAQAV